MTTLSNPCTWRTSSSLASVSLSGLLHPLGFLPLALPTTASEWNAIVASRSVVRMSISDGYELRYRVRRFECVGLIHVKPKSVKPRILVSRRGHERGARS